MALRQDRFDGCAALAACSCWVSRFSAFARPPQLKLIACPFEQILITSANRFEPPLLDRLAGDDHLVDPVEPRSSAETPGGQDEDARGGLDRCSAA